MQFSSQNPCALHNIDDCSKVLRVASSNHQCGHVAAGKLSHCQGPTAAHPCPFIRLSFANASEAQIVEGIQRLGHILRQHASAVETLLTSPPNGAQAC